MYIPAAFREEDRDTLHALIRAHSFATLVTTTDTGVPYASHLPFLLDEMRGEWGTLQAHLARGNPQWGHFAGSREALVLFQGPHGYVSPGHYVTQPSVPTWNYAVVHAYGVPRLTNEDTLREILAKSVAFYEPPSAAESDTDLPSDYLDKMVRAIVGFEIEITRLEGKFKLSQNRSSEDQDSVIAALERSGDFQERALAALMQTHLRKEEAP